MDYRVRASLGAAVGFAAIALSLTPAAQQVPTDGKSWTGHAPKGVRDPNLPPDEDAAKEQLAKSTLKSEWVDVKMAGGQTIKTFIVHPVLTTLRPRGGVVIVVHDDLGLTDWVRGVADQLAKHNFIAVAPDLLSGKGPNGGGTDTLGSQVGQAIQALTLDEVTARLDAVREYAVKIPTGTGSVATAGFGWGGGMSFNYALRQPQLNGACRFTVPSPPIPQPIRTRGCESWACSAARIRRSTRTSRSRRRRWATCSPRMCISTPVTGSCGSRKSRTART